MSAGRLKSTYLPDRVLADHVGDVFLQDGPTADFVASIIHPSLYFIPPLNKFRIRLVWLVNHAYFVGAILVLILINSVFLAMDDPKVQDNSTFNAVLEISDFVFLLIFTIEMILKLGAYGFALHSRSYARDPWNVLDGLVVVAGLATIAISGKITGGGGGVSALRVVRVFRPLRTVSKVRSLKHILTKVMTSLPSMRDVFVLLLFVSWLAAIAGVQLYIGVLNNRCYGDTRYYNTTSGQWTTVPNTTTDPAPAQRWTLIQNDTKICSRGSTGYQCGDSMVSVPVSCRVDRTQYSSSFLSFDNIGTGILLAFKLVSRDNWPVDLDNVVFATSSLSFLYFFVLTFFGGYFCLNLFIAVLTGAFSEGEEDDTVMIDTRIRFGAMVGGGIVGDAACFACHHSNATVDAVRRYAREHGEAIDEPEVKFDDPVGGDAPVDAAAAPKKRAVAFAPVDDEPPLIRHIPSRVPDSPGSLEFGDSRPPTDPSHQRQQPQRRQGGDAAAVAGTTVVPMDEDDDDEEEAPESLWDRLERFFEKTGVEPARVVVVSLPYELAVLFIIFVNAVVLSLDHRDADADITNVVSTTSYVCNWIFIADVIFKIVGLGPSFCTDGSNWFDLGLALLSIPDLIASENSSLSALRAFRLIRLLRLARQWRSLQQLLRLVKQSVQSVASLSLVSLIVIYIYAILGFQLFDTDIPEQRFSYGNVFDSLLTVFVIVTGENWATIMEGIMEEKGIWTFVYFLSLFVVGNFFIANLFIAIIIDNFSMVSKEGDEDDEDQGQDPDEALALDMMMLRLEQAKANGPSSRHDLDQRIFLDVTSDDEDDVGVTDLDQDPNSQEASGLLGPRQASKENVLGGESNDRNFVREASERRAKGTTACARVIASRLDLETNDEVKVVEEFASEFGIQPNAVGIVGNPAELRQRAESELQQLESTRAAAKRRQRRLDQLVSTAVSRIKRRVLRKTQVPTHLQLLDHKRRNRQRTITVAEREMEEEEWSGLHYSSLMCLTPTNPVREHLSAFLRHYATQVGLVLLTLYSSVMLALDDDDITGGPDSALAQVIVISDWVIAVLFVLEMALKMIVLGVAGHPGAYFRNKWNILDFIVTAAALVALGVPEAKPFLALRALRLTSLSFNLKVVVEALLSALPGMGSVMVFMGLLWWIFAVLGVALFKGVFYECNDGVSGRSDCVGTFNQTVQRAFRQEVVVTNRTWFSPMPSSRFDNLYEALYSLLKVSLSDGWFDIMYYAVDSQGADLPRKRNGSQQSALYFIAFMIIGNFFTINLFVGVLADRFVSLRQRGEGFHLISENQRQWVMAQKVLFRSQIDIIPEVPKNAVRKVCFRMAQHPAFDVFFTSLIVLNSIILSMYYFGMSDEYEFALDTAGLAILSFFTLELCIKVVGYNPIVYWRNPWNRLDAVVVLLSWVGVAVGNGISAVRLFRVFRLFLLLRKMKGVQTMFITLYQAVPELINVGVVLVVVYFLFAILGVFLFGKIARNGPLNDLVNFDHAGHALVTLYIATTTEGWADIADALRVEEPECSRAAGTCGEPYYAYPYMIIFMVLMALILMNLLVTVVLGNFLDARVAEGQESLFEVIEQFRERWTEHDPTGTQLVDVSVMLRLLPTLPSSIWDRSVPKIRGKQRSVWIHFLRQLEKFHIPIGRDHSVHYADAIASIAGRLFCISVTDAVEASQRTAHGVTWQGRTLSVHQHFAAIKLTRAVRHYLSTRGERILTQELRELREQHAVMLDVEYEPLRRSHRDTTVLCRWLISRLAESRADQRALEEQAQGDSSPGSNKARRASLTRRSRASSRGPQTPLRAFGQPVRPRSGSGTDLGSRQASQLTAMTPRQVTSDSIPVAPLNLPKVAVPPSATSGRGSSDAGARAPDSGSSPRPRAAAPTNGAASSAPGSPSPNPPPATRVSVPALPVSATGYGSAGAGGGGGHALHADPSAEIAALQLDRHRNWRQDTGEPFGTGGSKVVVVEDPQHPPSAARRALTPDSD